jgi:hypothetical protein
LEKQTIHTKYYFEKMKEGDNSGELREGRRIILKLTLKKHGVRIKTGLIWFRLESMGGSL